MGAWRPIRADEKEESRMCAFLRASSRRGPVNVRHAGHAQDNVPVTRVEIRCKPRPGKSLDILHIGMLICAASQLSRGLFGLKSRSHMPTAAGMIHLDLG